MIKSIILVFLIIFLLLIKNIENFNQLNTVNDFIKTQNPIIGKQGPKGSLGDIGDRGPMGPRGITISKNKGPSGYMGEKGDRGKTIKGPIGDTGPKGPPGGVKYPYGMTEYHDKFVINKYQLCLNNKCFTEKDFKKIKGIDPMTCPTTYNIKSKNIDYCLDTKKPFDINQIVEVNNCDKNKTEQLWEYDNDIQQIKHYNGICLNSTNNNFDKIKMDICNTKDKNKQWVYDPILEQIKNKYNKCLETNENNVYTNQCNVTNEKQKWNLV